VKDAHVRTPAVIVVGECVRFRERLVELAEQSAGAVA
jgi:hypothetical protein